MFIDGQGHEVPRCLRPWSRFSRRSDLAILEAVETQIGRIEERIAVLTVEDPRARLLMTMTGIGYFSTKPG